jgi:hypothetical protein
MTEPHLGLKMSELTAMPTGQAHRPDAGVAGPLGGLRPCPGCGRLWSGPRLRVLEATLEVVAVDRDPSICQHCNRTAVEPSP